MVDALIASVEQQPAPRCLVLGSDSYKFIRAALIERLNDIEAQEQTARATDADTCEIVKAASPGAGCSRAGGAVGAPPGAYDVVTMV
jgi:hypothetical protein